mgnify:CR=1 FL=1
MVFSSSKSFTDSFGLSFNGWGGEMTSSIGSSFFSRTTG